MTFKGAIFDMDGTLIDSLTFEFQFNSGISESQFAELPDRVLFTGSDDIIISLILLQDQPHAFDIVLRIAPVAQRVHVP